MSSPWSVAPWPTKSPGTSTSARVDARDERLELAGDFDEAERGMGTEIEACRDEIYGCRGSLGDGGGRPAYGGRGTAAASAAAGWMRLLVKEGGKRY